MKVKLIAHYPKCPQIHKYIDTNLSHRDLFKGLCCKGHRPHLIQLFTFGEYDSRYEKELFNSVRSVDPMKGRITLNGEPYLAKR